MQELRNDGYSALASRRARSSYLQRLRTVPQITRITPSGTDEEVDDQETEESRPGIPRRPEACHSAAGVGFTRTYRINTR
jgi:hypothetical protein